MQSPHYCLRTNELYFAHRHTSKHAHKIFDVEDTKLQSFGTLPTFTLMLLSTIEIDQLTSSIRAVIFLSTLDQGVIWTHDSGLGSLSTGSDVYVLM